MKAISHTIICIATGSAAIGIGDTITLGIIKAFTDGKRTGSGSQGTVQFPILTLALAQRITSSEALKALYLLKRQT